MEDSLTDDQRSEMQLGMLVGFILLQYPDACIGDKGHAYST